MREIRKSGSEGGGAHKLSLPLSPRTRSTLLRQSRDAGAPQSAAPSATPLTPIAVKISSVDYGEVGTVSPRPARHTPCSPSLTGPSPRDRIVVCQAFRGGSAPKPILD